MLVSFIQTFCLTPGETIDFEQLSDADIFRTYDQTSLINPGNGPCIPVYEYHYRDPLGNPLFGRTFQYASDFVNGFASVNVNGVWQFINRNGDTHIIPNVEYLGAISNDLAVAKSDSLYGYMKPNGTWAIKPKYDYARDFSDGLAWVGRDNKHFIINTYGEEIYEENNVNHHYHSEFHNGFSRIYNKEECIIIDKTGKECFKTESNTIHDFSNGLALCKTPEGYGYLDTHFKWIIPSNKGIDNGTSFTPSGIAAVSINGKWGLINKKGKFVLQPEFDNVQPYMRAGKENVKYWLVKKTNKEGIYDPDKKIFIVPIKYNKIGFFNNGSATIVIETGDSILSWDKTLIPKNKYGVLGPGLKILIPPIYDQIDRQRAFQEFFKVRKDGKEGIIAQNGNIILPTSYKLIYEPFPSGKLPYRWAVEFEDGKIGFTDQSGNLLYKSDYTYANSIQTSEDYSIVYKDSKQGLINSDFELVVPLEYYMLERLKEGFLLASKIIDGGNKRYGYIDYNGATLIPFIFEYASGFKDGKATVKLPNDKDYHHIDLNGKFID